MVQKTSTKFLLTGAAGACGSAVIREFTGDNVLYGRLVGHAAKARRRKTP